VKIKLFCEGKTEKGLRELLRKAVNQDLSKPCGLKIKTFDGVANLLKGIEGKLKIEFQEGAKVIYLLVDLYRYPNIEPKTLEERVKNVKEDIETKLGNRREGVKIFVIIHEVENLDIGRFQSNSKAIEVIHARSLFQFGTRWKVSTALESAEPDFQTASPERIWI
jgi:hypothetical protein